MIYGYSIQQLRVNTPKYRTAKRAFDDVDREKRGKNVDQSIGSTSP